MRVLSTAEISFDMIFISPTLPKFLEGLTMAMPSACRFRRSSTLTRVTFRP
jgi:hypothetical protein